MRVLILLMVLAAAQARQLKTVAANADTVSLMSIIPALVKGDSCSDFMMGPATGLAATATAAIEAYKASKGYTTQFAIPHGLYVNVCQKAPNGVLSIQINYLTEEPVAALSGCMVAAEAMRDPGFSIATGVQVLSASCLAVVPVENNV